MGDSLESLRNLTLSSDEHYGPKDDLCLNIKSIKGDSSFNISFKNGTNCEIVLISNCNNQLQYPKDVHLHRPETFPNSDTEIVCRPHDIIEMGKEIELKFINRGGGNEVYDIGNGVFRMTNKTAGIEIKNNEMYGLYIQNLLSKDIHDGGLGCKYICKIYDFGEFKVNPQTSSSYYNWLFQSTFGNTGVYAFLEKMKMDIFSEITHPPHPHQKN